VHNLVLGFNDLWIVLKVQITGYKATIQFHDLGDLEFAMFRLVQTTGGLDNLHDHEKQEPPLDVSASSTEQG
jgi:hypothetical protein